MGDAVTQGQFFQAIEQLRKDNQEMHQRLRDDLTDGFGRVSDIIRAHESVMAKHTEQLAVIAAEKKTEEKVKNQYAKRDIAIFGSLSGAAGYVIAKGGAFLAGAIALLSRKQ